MRYVDLGVLPSNDKRKALYIIITKQHLLTLLQNRFYYTQQFVILFV